MHKKIKDIISGTCIVVFAVLLYYQSLFVRSMAKSTLTASFMPKLVSICLFLLGLIIIIKAGFALIKNPEQQKKSDTSNKSLVLLTFCFFAGYVFSIKSAGYFLPTILYIFLQAFLMAQFNKKKTLPLLIYAVITTTIIYVIFKYGFDMLIPSGSLFSSF